MCDSSAGTYFFNDKTETCYKGGNGNTMGAIYSTLCTKIRNCMLDKEGSHSKRGSTATAQMQFTTLTNLI